MEYIDNQDGTFSVRAWLIDFYGKRQNCYVYSQKVLADWMGDWGTPPFTADMVWLKRDHRPVMGTEIEVQF